MEQLERIRSQQNFNLLLVLLIFQWQQQQFSICCSCVPTGGLSHCVVFPWWNVVREHTHAQVPTWRVLYSLVNSQQQQQQQHVCFLVSPLPFRLLLLLLSFFLLQLLFSESGQMSHDEHRPRADDPPAPPPRLFNPPLMKLSHSELLLCGQRTSHGPCVSLDISRVHVSVDLTLHSLPVSTSEALNIQPIINWSTWPIPFNRKYRSIRCPR